MTRVVILSRDVVLATRGPWNFGPAATCCSNAHRVADPIIDRRVDVAGRDSTAGAEQDESSFGMLLREESAIGATLLSPDPRVEAPGLRAVPTGRAGP